MNRNSRSLSSIIRYDPPMGDALLLVFHGSRDPEGNSGVETLRADVETRVGLPVVAGHLEYAAPLVANAIEEMVARGFRGIVAVPVLLGAAGHVKNDIPRLIEEARRRHPGVRFETTTHLGTHDAILEILEERLIEAERSFPTPGNREATSLILAARGSSDPDGNAEVAHVARRFGEPRGFRSVHAAYIGVTRPDPAEAISAAADRGSRRILVLPYLLFPGLMLTSLAGSLEEAGRGTPEIQLAIGRPLGPDPRVAIAIVERYRSFYSEGRKP
jgi:sirohydrochlorin cobaltochelatase